MFPVYQQGGGHGIGLQLDEFIKRFKDVCEEHVAEGRTKAFAFIFYDLENDEMKKILADQGVFAQLDRLTGSLLTVFYLHAGNDSAIKPFNSLLRELDIAGQSKPPCVLFFRLSKDKLITDISVAVIASPGDIHGFKELYDIIKQYLEQLNATPRYVRWLKSGGKTVGIEVLIASLIKLVEHSGIF